jgi:hypothetical protein
MPQFTRREAVSDWLEAHAGRRIRLSSAGSTLSVVGIPDGVTELDACSTEVHYGELETDLPAVQVALTLHEDVLALHVRVGAPDAGGSGDAALSLPLSVPYQQLRLEPVPAAGAATPAHPPRHPHPQHPEEAPPSPYELLHTPRSD